MITIDKRKSLFWHWYCKVVLHTKPNKDSYKNLYRYGSESRFDNPFFRLQQHTAEASNNWELVKLFRERVRRNKHCKCYSY